MAEPMRAELIALYREANARRDEIEDWADSEFDTEDDAIEALMLAVDAYVRHRGWSTQELYEEAVPEHTDRDVAPSALWKSRW
jgi:hypothetical protein